MRCERTDVAGPSRGDATTGHWAARCEFPSCAVSARDVPQVKDAAAGTGQSAAVHPPVPCWRHRPPLCAVLLYCCVVDLAVAGSMDSGKSTLVAVLTQGADGRPLLDNGRGSARMPVFRHKHEIESGRTSSISHQV
jgi:hypothetical protein